MSDWSTAVRGPTGQLLLAGRTGRVEALALAAVIGRFWPRLRVSIRPAVARVDPARL